MAKKCARTFSIVVEKGKKSILDVRHLLPDALPRSVRRRIAGTLRDSATRSVRGGSSRFQRGIAGLLGLHLRLGLRG